MDQSIGQSGLAKSLKIKQTNVTAAVTRDTGNLTHSTKVVSLFFMDLNFIALQTKEKLRKVVKRYVDAISNSINVL